MKRLVLLGFALRLLSGFAITAAPSNPACDLVEAIINNDIDGARRLIASGIDVNGECAGALPLSMASEYGRTEIVRALIEAHAKIDAVDATSRTALHWAAANGHAEVVSALIAGGADVQRNDMRGRAPLDLASRNGHLEATQVVIEGGAKVANGKPDVLGDAVASRNREMVQLLLDAGADPLGKTENGRSAFSDAGAYCNADVLRLLVQQSAGRKEQLFFLGKALRSAAEKGNWDCLEFLLYETPVDVNFRVDSAGKQVSINENGSCALSEAIEDSDEHVVRFLLESGASFGKDDPYLLNAYRRNQKEMFDVLLKYGAPVNADNFGRTVLMEAAAKGDAETVDLLLRHKASVNVADDGGMTPLLAACQSGNQKIINALLKQGASLESKDKDGTTTLMFAAMNGHEAICRFLGSQHVDVNAKQRTTGKTALHFAAAGNHAGVVKALLNLGASAKAKDSEGKTPADYAERQGATEVVALLGAKQPKLDQ